MMDKPFSTLLYGAFNSGKSATAVSAFWDFKARKQIRDGRWLTFGREQNDALGVPEELVHRFASPEEHPLQFRTDFRNYMHKAIFEARKGQGPEIYVLDGITELSIIFEDEFVPEKSDDTYSTFKALKSTAIEFTQLTDPRELRAHVIVTARVDERKKGTYNKRTSEVLGKDPEWMEDYAFYPAVEGAWSRRNLPHYYQLVGYMDADIGTYERGDGTKVPGTVHKLYLTSAGKFYTKNQWEHRWLALSLPSMLVNPMFDDVLQLIEKARA